MNRKPHVQEPHPQGDVQDSLAKQHHERTSIYALVPLCRFRIAKPYPVTASAFHPINQSYQRPRTPYPKTHKSFFLAVSELDPQGRQHVSSCHSGVA